MKVKCLACKRPFTPNKNGASDVLGPLCVKKTLSLVTGPVQLPLVHQEQPEPEKKEITHDYYDVNGKFLWANKSDVTNEGVDISGAARHKRNAGRSYEDFLKGGEEESRNTKVNDVKNMMIKSLMDKEDVDLSLKKALILKKLPTKPNEKLDDFYKEFAKKVFDSESPEVFVEARNLIVTEITRLRNANRFSREANTLVGLHNAMRVNKNSAFWTYLGLNRDAEASANINAFKKNAIANLSKGKAAVPGKKKRKSGEEYNESQFYAGVKPETSRSQFKDEKEAKKFIMDSGFRAIEFGNALSDEERKLHSKMAAQSIKDMSEVLGVSSKKLSANGKLALCFGSRGTKGSMAHYRNSNKTININRTGAGALAHEIAHAIDYELGEGSYAASDSYGHQYFQDFNSSTRSYISRIQSDDQLRNMSRSARNRFCSKKEVFARVMEAYVSKRCEENGIKNTYLAGGIESALYPTKEELEEMAPKIETILQKLRD